MDIEDIKAMIIDGESVTLDFKQSLANLKGAAQSLCAFLNATGGTVLIGVTNNKKIVGQHVSDQTQQEVARTLKKFEPTANIQVHYVKINRSDKQVIVLIAIPDQNFIPYTFDSRSYERNGTTTSKMSQARYHQLLLSRTNNPVCWDEQLADDVSIEDLDIEEIKKTVHLGNHSNRILSDENNHVIETILKKLKLIRNGTLTNAAVVLFCKDIPAQYMQCLIRLARFKGNTKGNFIDSRRIFGHAFALLEEALIFIQRNTSISSHFEAGNWQRIDEPEYPFTALREALINAICHRDYTLNTGSISVAIYDDFLEITSPGGLPYGMTVEHLTEAHDSNPRNKSIANTLFRRGMIETFGIGIQSMLEACRDLGTKPPDFIESDTSFTVRFWSKSAAKAENVNSLKLSTRQREIFLLLETHEKLTLNELHGLLNKPPAERTLRSDLKRLKEIGLVKLTGNGRAARWSIK